MRLENKVAMVSGGNGGIGSVVVAALHEGGAKVYSIDIDDAVPNVIEGVHYLSADLTDKSQLEQAALLVDDEIDILFLNTGAMRRGTIFDSSEEDYDLLFNSNVKAPWMLLKYLRPKLQEDALIIQMSSGHALNPEADPGIYTLTKKAAAALAEVVAVTCPNFDVRTVYPGPVLTKLLLTDRSEDDVARIRKIAHTPDYVAAKIIELIESDKQSLVFDPQAWDYNLQ